MELNQLFSLSFIFLCLAIAAVTEVLRRFVDLILSSPNVPIEKTSKFWNKFLIPISPLVNGVLFGLFVTQYPYPESWGQEGARVVFGMVAGLLSGLVYRVAKSFLKDKLQTLKNNSTPPPPHSLDS